jgi:hypothetical protein
VSGDGVARDPAAQGRRNLFGGDPVRHQRAHSRMAAGQCPSSCEVRRHRAGPPRPVPISMLSAPDPFPFFGDISSAIVLPYQQARLRCSSFSIRAPLFIVTVAPVTAECFRGGLSGHASPVVIT